MCLRHELRSVTNKLLLHSYLQYIAQRRARAGGQDIFDTNLGLISEALSMTIISRFGYLVARIEARHRANESATFQLTTITLIEFGKEVFICNF